MTALMGPSISLVGPRRSGAGAPARYLGFVADRTRFHSISNTGNKQTMSRSGHTASTDITSLKILLAGYMTSSGSEKGFTAVSTDTMTVEASIEYPAGVFTRLTFSGGNQGTLKLANSAGSSAAENHLWSDFATIAIPKGQVFWVRMWTTSTAGILYHTSPSRVTALGDLLTVGVSGVANAVMGGAIAQSVGGTCATPAAIVGMTDAASVVLVGDSIQFGQGYTHNGVDFRQGIVGANMPAGTAHVNLGLPGATTTDWYTKAINMRELIQFASHMFNNLGVNGSDDAAGKLAANQAIAALFPASCKKYLVTITPRGSSTTDAWTSAAGQTVHGGNATYVPYNALVRAGVAGYNGFVEVRRGALEAPPDDSGKWQNNAGVALTSDGLHPNTAGYDWVGLQGKVPAALFAL